MKERDYRDYLQDILDSVCEIESYIKGMSYEDFKRDRKTINAVVRSIEVMGEAAKRIPRALKTKWGGIPWRQNGPWYRTITWLTSDSTIIPTFMLNCSCTLSITDTSKKVQGLCQGSKRYSQPAAASLLWKSAKWSVLASATKLLETLHKTI